MRPIGSVMSCCQSKGMRRPRCAIEARKAPGAMRSAWLSALSKMRRSRLSVGGLAGVRRAPSGGASVAGERGLWGERPGSLSEGGGGGSGGGERVAVGEPL